MPSSNTHHRTPQQQSTEHRSALDGKQCPVKMMSYPGCPRHIPTHSCTQRVAIAARSTKRTRVGRHKARSLRLSSDQHLTHSAARHKHRQQPALQSSSTRRTGQSLILCHISFVVKHKQTEKPDGTDGNMMKWLSVGTHAVPSSAAQLLNSQSCEAPWLSQSVVSTEQQSSP